MWTAGPAAGLSFALRQIRNHALDVLVTCLLLLDDGDPVNPFIALDGSEGVPFRQNACTVSERRFNVRRHFMEYAVQGSCPGFFDG